MSAFTCKCGRSGSPYAFRHSNGKSESYCFACWGIMNELKNQQRPLNDHNSGECRVVWRSFATVAIIALLVLAGAVAVGLFLLGALFGK